ncbi:MAG: HAD family phosphatase [Alphaproteobacteria bacterium]|nr:HAD family phosphatase [Alphaproteobacteria bacterium]MBV8548023.1 HAD family phosphatase [Alphaproteobacteria bacterium]
MTLIIDQQPIEADGYLFDLDGTLVNSETTLSEIWADILGQHGIQKTPEEVSPLIRGRMAKVFMRELIPGLSEEAYAAILHDVIEREENAPFELMPGARAFVIEAKAAGKKVGLVTSSWRAKVDKLLARHDMTDLFDITVVQEDVQKTKPDPEPYLTAIIRMNMPPSSLITFEDSRAGIQSAKQAGLRCIGYGAERLADTGADAWIHDFRDHLLQGVDECYQEGPAPADGTTCSKLTSALQDCPHC